VGAPGWLEDLSRRAGLNKERASLSFLLLEPPVDADGGNAGAGLPTATGDHDVLVVSGSFPLPGEARGRYGCAARGLVLLEEVNPGPEPGPGPGDLVRVVWPEQPRRDARSGASVVPLPVRAGPSRGRPPHGRPPSGHPPHGRPPSGHPPSGRPPSGRPPSGRPPRGRRS
jgi:hypothetical protein